MILHKAAASISVILSLALVLVSLIGQDNRANATSGCGGTTSPSDGCRIDCNVYCYRTSAGPCYKCITD